LSPPTFPTPPSEDSRESDAGSTEPRPTLKTGDSGDDVMLLQARLAALGVLTSPVDGIFGPATEAAVKEVQRRVGVEPTGVVDERTAGSIADVTEEDADLGPGTTGGSTPGTPEPKSRLVVNETNRRLVITGPGGKVLVLSPLERRTIPEDDFEDFKPLLDDLQRRSVVALPPNEASNALGLILGGAVWALVIFGAFGLFRGSSTYWIVGAAAIALAVIILAVAAKLGRTAVWRWTLQLAALVVILAVGIALPGSAVYFSAGVDQLVQAAYFDGTLPQDQLDLTLLGRGLQLLFLAAVSLLPALLYFLFDRQQLRTLREQFERHMFRLDPSIQTLADVRAKYGTLLEEAYGPVLSHGGGRLLPGRRSPVLVATIVITLGWLLTLLNPDVGLITDRAGIIQLFQPDPSTIVFGFLGAYFFALMTIQRGYARGDLRPKTYTQITVRIFVAIIFAWVLQLSPGDDEAGYLLLLAFAAGIVPETAIVWLREGLRGKPGKEFSRWMAERDPLTNLEGIDLYDRARLLDEGITNVEGLAHHDLIELLLQTRIPAPRLVDWTDQAILYLHVGTSSVETDEKPPMSRQDAIRQLNAHGIRTATDLEQAHWEAKERGDLDTFLQIVPGLRAGTPPRLSIILDTIRDEEWMANLRNWHKPVHLFEHTLDWPPSAPAEAAAEPELPTDAGNGVPEPATPASLAPAG